MGANFNINDVFEMAEQMEKNGEEFYRKMAERTDDHELQDMLHHLADMEVMHAKLFAAMRGELSEMEKGAGAFDPDDEAAQYLKTIVDSEVSFEHDFKSGSLVDILESAIESEKDTVIFYLGIKEAVPSRLGKNKIDQIISEEMLHIRIINQEINKIKRAAAA
jgi:rubrerythrin